MPRTILVVDDNEVNRKVLQKILRGEYDVLEAENGSEALVVMNQTCKYLSAVLLDIVMPVMDGYGVLASMQADPQLAQIPVIVTTGNTDDHAEMKALSLGANDFVTKPYKPEIIKRRLKNTINLRETAAMVNTIQRDKLTGLYNREAFFSRAEEMTAEQEAGHYVMACFDVDNFKLINDQYGSAKGDEVLKQLADIFRKGFNPAGGIAGRVTADNFAVLYPSSFLESEELAEIRRAAARLDGSIPPISFSVGRYVVTDLSLSGSAMYDRAAMAAASVKARFDVRIAQYNEDMRVHILKEQEIISEMETALESGQFEPWFQPQYNHSSGGLIGAEALVRWRHPEKGLIQPDIFIPVFERNGFIYEMDKNIWEQCCALLRKWIDQGRNPLPVAVNVSRYDLFRDDFFEAVTGLVEKYQIPLELLRLEVTESAFAQSSRQIIAMVERLIAYGFIVEIDDFGSGYSSLNTLKDVPASVLKLDMRFLEDGGNSSRGGNILESIIRMAKWLGMPVIAEGVETKEQADYLLSVGCFYMQGYLYAGPMPLEDYEALAAGSSKEREMITLETVETLDNDAFWNPQSMETLIFNSYVGGACIFEYHNGKMELLRINEKYARELGGEGLSMEEALRIELPEYLDESNLAIMSENIQNAIRTDADSTCEVCMVGLPGDGEKTYIRSTVRVIARVGERMLLYCAITNVTAQREAEQKEKESAEQLRFLNDTAHDLLAQPDHDKGINNMLRKVLEYFQGSRAYVIEMDYMKMVLNNTYEVCAPGVSSEIENVQGLTYEDYPFWWSAFDGDKYINIEDVSALDGSRLEERRILEAQGVNSLIAVPLNREGMTIGFIGVDDPQRHHSHVRQLRAIGDYLAVILTRRDLNARIENDNRALQGLMNDTPGGFVRMRIRPDGAIVPVYVNQGFADLVEMTVPEVLKKYKEDILWGVHPEDTGVVQDAIDEMKATGRAHSAKYRLRHGNGGYIWIRIFGRATKNAAGEMFFNIYYTDMSMAERENELVLRAVAEHSNRLVYRYDLATRTSYADGAEAARRKGLAKNTDIPEGLIRKGDILPESVEDYRQIFREIHQGKPRGSATLHMKDAEGTPRWIDYKYSLIYNDDQTPRLAVLSLKDVTANHEQELAYDRYLQTLNQGIAAEGVLVYLEADVTADRTEKRGGPLLPEKFPAEGCSREETISIITENVAGEDRERCRSFFSRERLITAFSDGVHKLIEDWNVTFPDGKPGHVRSEVQMVKDPYSGHIKAYTIVRDITDEKRRALSIKRQAETDGMTGLYNKTTTEALIQKRLAQSDGVPCGLLLVDLDDLKGLNDSLGHSCGDEGIRIISDTLRKQFRQTDIVGRVGGDEFVGFMEGGSQARLSDIAEAFMQDLANVRIGGNKAVSLRGSAGIAMGVTGGDSYEDLFQRADKALYHVKRNGKDDYAFYTPDMELTAYEYKGHREEEGAEGDGE